MVAAASSWTRSLGGRGRGACQRRLPCTPAGRRAGGDDSPAAAAGSTKTLDVHVAALRSKLAAATGDAHRVPLITTLRSHGYRLELDRREVDSQPTGSA